jgi:hypothetical protein
MKPKPEGKERRKCQRFDRVVDLAVSVNGKADYVGRSINLSCNGAYCAVSQPIPVMTALHVRIQLPGAGRSHAIECVECGGVVVRSEPSHGNGGKHPYHVAIFFNHISQAAVAKFARFFEQPPLDSDKTSIRLPLAE